MTDHSAMQPPEPVPSGKTISDVTTRAQLLANQDDCLAALVDRRQMPQDALDSLPPWRAVMLCRIALRAGTPFAARQLQASLDRARAQGAASATLAEWYER